MNQAFYEALVQKSLQDSLDPETCLLILNSPEIEILSLVSAAFEIRKKFFEKEVFIHVLNNVQNGHCSEDCHYCAQSRSSNAVIETYPMKNEEEIMFEAKQAHESGAFRYCMVFSGASPSAKRVEQLIHIIQRIKSLYKMEVCVSPGVMDKENLIKLKKAGLDRLNHNINTSKAFYPKICTSHSYEARLNTLEAASEIGLDICSGVIAGMGESHEDIVSSAFELKNYSSVKSIPVNFLLPIPGNKITEPNGLSPEYCLRVLCLFRFLHPSKDIRTAAGRELHLRNLEVFCLYPATSLFINGYLNTQGESQAKTLQMIKDAGFKIKSDHPIDQLLQKLSKKDTKEGILMKDRKDLKPLS